MISLPIIDLIFFCILLIFAITACFKGFVNELFDRGAPIIGLWAAIIFYKRLAALLFPYLRFQILANVFGFILVFILVFLVVKIAQQIIGNIFAGKIFRQLDHTLGFAFGVLEGLAVIALILILLNSQPWFNVSSIVKESIFYKLFLTFLSSVSAAHDSGAATVIGA